MPEPNTASWIWVSESFSVAFYKCSSCGYGVSILSKQKNCPGCGAKMEDQNIIDKK